VRARAEGYMLASSTTGQARHLLPRGECCLRLGLATLESLDVTRDNRAGIEPYDCGEAPQQ